MKRWIGKKEKLLLIVIIIAIAIIILIIIFNSGKKISDNSDVDEDVLAMLKGDINLDALLAKKQISGLSGELATQIRNSAGGSCQSDDNCLLMFFCENGVCKNPCPCKGDMNGDGWLSPADVGGIVSWLLPHKNNSYWVTVEEENCGDMNGDGWLSPADVSSLVSQLLSYQDAYYWVECSLTEEISSCLERDKYTNRCQKLLRENDVKTICENIENYGTKTEDYCIAASASALCSEGIKTNNQKLCEQGQTLCEGIEDENVKGIGCMVCNTFC